MDNRLFFAPPHSFRPTAFWSWNDRLAPEELKRQIDQMEQTGWGGFFMHARAGLKTEYLSEEWMDAVKQAVESARNKGMYAWLYDEDGWPSGSRGCKIPALDEAFRETHLYLAFNEIPHHREDVQLLRVCRAKKIYGRWARSYRDTSIDYKLGTFEDIEPNEAGDHSGDAVDLYFYRWTAPLCNERFRGASYVNLLNKDATQAFIQSTHELYRKECAPEFGSTIPGIFTDDITVVWDVFRNKKNALPWTGDLPELFSGAYGYSLLEFLPHLYFPLEGYVKVRHDYYRLVSKLFAEHYTKVIYDWCSGNKLQSTGHLMADESINLDVMLHYAYMHTPATDHLGLKARGLMVNRRMQSVASQLGKERTICEVFGGAGQNLTFEDQKAVTDWLAVNGANSLTMHLSLYSLRGLRKRDHPPVLSWQQPWWEYNRTIADYQARLCYALSQGTRIVDVVVIDPVESRSACYSPLEHALSDKITKVVMECQETLLEKHYDYELASEEILAQYGQAKDGVLHIGRAGYKLVIVPKVVTLRGSTLRLLQDFIGSGGLLLVLDALPRLVDGSPSPQRIEEALSVAKVIPSYRLAETLDGGVLPARVRIRLENGEPAGSVLYHLRADGDKLICFLANRDVDNGYAVTVSLDGLWQMRYWDLDNGQVRPLDSQACDTRTEFAYRFAPGASMLLQLAAIPAEGCGMQEAGAGMETGAARADATRADAGKTGAEGGAAKRGVVKTYAAAAKPGSIIPVSGDWELDLLELNALTLDMISCSADGSPYTPADYCLKVKQQLQAAGKPYSLAYTFTAEGWNGEGGFVIMEDPEQYRVSLNGKEIKAIEGEWWKDPAFRKLPIGGLVQDGENVLELKGEWLGENVAEAVYVIGDFIIRPEEHRRFVITPRENPVFIKDLTREGYPFYAGNAAISNKFTLSPVAGKRYYLQLGQLDAVLAEVEINGNKAGEIWHQPYRLDITSLLVEGVNRVVLKLAGSLHNLLGPHHMDTIPDNPFISPFNFEDYNNWQESYYFVPFGVAGVEIREEEIIDHY
ncbi:MAG: hypothetical protein K0R57_229 [Paenibacillaceae bacterium]|jgi:hypothetical protein|nr:hypothetical protein [Paenibacillaceae bacterium]